MRDQARPLSASQHLLHRSRSVGPAAARDMTLRGERLRYLPQRLALPMRGWIQRAVPLLPECSARPGGASTALLPQTRGRGRCRAGAFDSAAGSVDAAGHLAYLHDQASKYSLFRGSDVPAPEPQPSGGTRLSARRTAPRDRAKRKARTVRPSFRLGSRVLWLVEQPAEGDGLAPRRDLLD